MKIYYEDLNSQHKEKLEKAAAGVIGAYQDANKHLDEVKEFIYTDLSCPFFSSFVHSLAHSMPERFDKFGDILHTVNMRIPYPTTYQLKTKLKDMDDCIKVIFESLDAIKDNLNDFIELTDKQNHGMAVASENLLNDIEAEYPMLFRIAKKWEQSKDLVEFDKYVMQYVEHKDDLLESANKVKRATILTESMNEVPDKDEIVMWLAEHETATEDFERHFGVSLDSDRWYGRITTGEILDWISDHERLTDDFERYFGITLE